jgi:maleylpyruvate isomerase
VIRLHDYFRSGTSHRVRIALALKGVSYERAPVNLAQGAHQDDAFAALNPQKLAPALEINGVVLTQSPAILEWIEETYPEPPLLPQDAIARAKVRAMVHVPACDIHPLNNLRVLKYVRARFGADDAAVQDWCMEWVRPGFAALETLIGEGPGDGPWAWGAALTLADCAIAPQIYAAVSRYQLDLSAYPRLARLAGAADAHPAFQAAHPSAQSDAV